MLTTVIDLAVSGIFLASIYILVGVGMSLLYGVSQTINLAHGDFMIVGAYLTFVAVSALGLPSLWMLIVVPPVMGVVGMALFKVGGFSRVLTRPLSRGDREFTTMIMTFALAWIASNFLAAVFTADSQAIRALPGSFVAGDLAVPYRKLLTIAVAFPLVGVIWLIIKRTWIGLGIRCVFDDNDASKLMGVNVDRVHFIIFFIAFLAAGLGGSLFSMNFGIDPFLGTELTILAIVVTIIGGIGSVKGALLAGIIVALAEAYLMFFISPLLKISYIYALFIAILLLKPSGLFKSM